MIAEFKKDILQGLMDDPKHLPSKYFYDEVGDKLFVKIMNCEEYYLTRSEFEIFQTKSQDIIDLCGMNTEGFDIFELGAGDGTKTVELLKRIEVDDFTFNPIDISQNALDGIQSMLKDATPNIQVHPMQGDYFSVLNKIQSHRKKVILFLGSNIGNLNDNKAHEFIDQLSQSLNKGDVLLLGVDLIKDGSIVLPAYDDKNGYTKAFNMNLLARINNELQGDFDLNKFSHEPEYSNGYAKS